MVVKQTKKSKTLQTTADVYISCTRRCHCREPTQNAACFPSQWRETNTADQTRASALTTTPVGALLCKAVTKLIRHEWHLIRPVFFNYCSDVSFRHDHRHHHFCRVKFVRSSSYESPPSSLRSSWISSSPQLIKQFVMSELLCCVEAVQPSKPSGLKHAYCVLNCSSAAYCRQCPRWTNCLTDWLTDWLTN